MCKILTQPDNIWIRLLKANCLKNNLSDFLKVNKSYSTSNAWENILSHNDLFKKGLKWILGNRNNIRFLYGNWMNEFPLTNRLYLTRRSSQKLKLKLVTLLLLLKL